MTDEATFAAICAEKAFLKLSPADRNRVFADLAETRRLMEDLRHYERYDDPDVIIRNREAMMTHLARICSVLDDPAGRSNALFWLSDVFLGARDYSIDGFLGEGIAANRELQAFRRTAQRLSEGAKAFEYYVGRRGRGMPLHAERTRQAFDRLIETLESVGVPVPVSLGPGTRLLALLIAHAVGSKVRPETVKKLVQQRRRSK